MTHESAPRSQEIYRPRLARTRSATSLRAITHAADVNLAAVHYHFGSKEAMLQEQLGLTRREADVLLWISRGKANRDISTILDISPRTVNKHLEQVFEKLGVDNRAAAAARAVRALS